MEKVRKTADGFTLMFGKEFPHEWIFTDKWHALIITSKGVYYDGECIAKGKLKLTKSLLEREKS